MNEDGVRTIYVDLDQTLVRVDLLTERLLHAMVRNPFLFFHAVFWLLSGGRTRLKTEVARRYPLDVVHLPYNEELLAFLKEERKAGQALVLATAAPSEWAKAIARHLAIFDRVLASDETRGNLKGRKKLEAIQKDCGGKAFGYAGDAPCDEPIFEAARLPIVVGSQISLAGKNADKAILIRAHSGNDPAWWWSLRPQEWSKNGLIFVPAIAAHRLDQIWPNAFIAFVVFCLVTSAVYLLNDFSDIDADRKHPDKRLRSQASGVLLPVPALGMAALLFIGAVIPAFFLPEKFALLLAGYAALNFLYSIALKNVPVLDLVTLAFLFSLRLFAGGAACQVHVAWWLFAFVFFLGLSLAHLKRYIETMHLLRDRSGGVVRPTYGANDEALVMKVGLGAGLLSVLVLALYVAGPEAVSLYKSRALLFIVCAALFYWIERIWSLARREKIAGDPVVFIVTDPVSYLVIFASILVVSLASAL